jgi:hypothetical protein
MAQVYINSQYLVDIRIGNGNSHQPEYVKESGEQVDNALTVWRVIRTLHLMVKYINK